MTDDDSEGIFSHVESGPEEDSIGGEEADNTNQSPREAFSGNMVEDTGPGLPTSERSNQGPGPSPTQSVESGDQEQSEDRPTEEDRPTDTEEPPNENLRPKHEDDSDRGFGSTMAGKTLKTALPFAIPFAGFWAANDPTIGNIVGDIGSSLSHSWGSDIYESVLSGGYKTVVYGLTGLFEYKSLKSMPEKPKRFLKMSSPGLVPLVGLGLAGNSGIESFIDTLSFGTLGDYYTSIPETLKSDFDSIGLGDYYRTAVGAVSVIGTYIAISGWRKEGKYGKSNQTEASSLMKWGARGTTALSATAFVLSLYTVKQDKQCDLNSNQKDTLAKIEYNWEESYKKEKEQSDSEDDQPWKYRISINARFKGKETDEKRTKSTERDNIQTETYDGVEVSREVYCVGCPEDNPNDSEPAPIKDPAEKLIKDEKYQPTVRLWRRLDRDLEGCTIPTRNFEVVSGSVNN